MNSVAVFDEFAEAYDSWYEIPRGNAIFEAEMKCIRCLQIDYSGQWLEVGIGTGRFAKAIGIVDGVDPSQNMLEKALSRGIRVQAARAEALPYRSSAFDGILMALTLCFIEDPQKSFKECLRVLGGNGSLVLGMVPADSPWGRQYRHDGMQGHPIYSHAIFYKVSEAVSMAKGAGLKLQRTCSTLLEGPECKTERLCDCAVGHIPGAGFVALHFCV